MTSYVNLCGSRHGGFKPRFRRRDTKQCLRVARHTYPPVSDAETSVRVQLGIEVDDGRRQPWRPRWDAETLQNFSSGVRWMNRHQDSHASQTARAFQDIQGTPA